MDNCPEKPALPAPPWDRSILNKLSDGLIQLAAAEGSRGGRAMKSPLAKEKKANRSLEDGWLFFFVPIVAEAVSVPKEAG